MTDPVPDLEPIAYLNGTFVPFREAVLPVYDLGLVQGATLTERLRTVHQVPYLLGEHLERLAGSVRRCGWSDVPASEELAGVVDVLTRRNALLISPEEELSIVVFVTAGQAISDANGLARESRPTVCVHSSLLPVEKWSAGYRHGIDLVTPEIRQIPPESLDPTIKSRSRLHWYLADREAADRQPGSMALLLDQQEFVTETSSGNLFVVREGTLCTPRAESTLPGIAQAYVMQLAQRLGIPVQRADLTVADVTTAEEAFLTSSTYCILPVSRLNGERIGHAVPGPATRRLTSTWSDEMGLDFTAAK